MGLSYSGSYGVLQLLLRGVAVLFATAIGYYLHRGYQVRSTFRSLRQQGIVSWME